MPGLNFRGEYIKLETNDGTVSQPFVNLQILNSGAIVFAEPILIM